MIDVTKIVREITYNGTKIPLLGTGDNIIKVSTEAELNALLVPENVDKLVAYDGELYVIAEDESSTNTPIAAGDTIDKLYFNTGVSDEEMRTYLSALTYDSGQSFLFMGGSEGNTDTDGVVVNDMSFITSGEIQEYLMVVLDNHEQQPAYIYSSGDFEFSGISFTKGWSANQYTFSSSIDVATVNDQDLWGNFISREPFGGNIIAKPIAGKLLRVDSNGDIVAEIIAYAEEASF